MSGPPSGKTERAPPAALDQTFALARGHVEAGRLDAAAVLCRQMLAAEPAHAATLHLCGLAAYRAGSLAAAIDWLRRAVAAAGGVALYHRDLGELCRQAGRLDEAVAAAERALALDPGDADALNTLGIVCFERRAFDAAVAHYRRALALAPRHAAAQGNLGNALRALGRLDEAIAAYRRAIELAPAHPDAHNNLGTTLRDLGRPSEAEAAYRRAVALNPGDPALLDNLALALRDQERRDEAAAILEQSLALAPARAKAFTCLALVRFEQGRLEEAHQFACRSLGLDPLEPEALNLAGLILSELDRGEEALACYQRAITRHPGFADPYNNAGNVLKEAGRLAEASAAYAKAIALAPRRTAPYLNLASLKTFAPGDPHLAMMEALAQKTDALPPGAPTALHFALAKAYDDLGATEQAFAQLQEGNALKRREIRYDEAATHGFFDRIRAVFDPELLAAKAGGGDMSAVPIFILGMPRSGSTLVEQIVASHPEVHGAGELPHLLGLVDAMRGGAAEGLSYPEAARALAPEQFGRLGRAYLQRLGRPAAPARRITDKMPANFCFVGLIHLALPHACIIHTTRDPVDTCFSCFSTLFKGEQNHAYDLGELGRYYRKYAELMAHWRAVLPPGRMLEVRYEDVVGDLEAAARRILDHCGLGWNDACLAFHRSPRRVKTASASQVRRPIYSTARGRAERYRQFLAPLLEALGPLAR